MKEVLGILAAVVVIIFGIAWIGLYMDRHMQKFQEETRKEVYDTSRQYEQGMNRDIARYCEQMRRTDNGQAKKAVAALIRSNMSTFDGRLSEDNQSCVSEANSY